MDNSKVLIMPINRVLKPLVMRRSGEQERQRQREDQQSGQSSYGRNDSGKATRLGVKIFEGILSDHRVDFRI